jgi:hypothetical protein
MSLTMNLLACLVITFTFFSSCRNMLKTVYLRRVGEGLRPATTLLTHAGSDFSSDESCGILDGLR